MANGKKQANPQLSDELINNIESYAGQIKTLVTFAEMVRKRPGMYIGPINDRGLLNMIREILQNSIDQLIDPGSPCNAISIYYNEIDNVTIIEDNGLGIPFDDIVRVFTSQHTSRNFDEKPKGRYSSGLNGVGAKATNALSQYFIVESYKYTGEARRAEFHEGVLVGEVQPIPNEQCKQGTKVIFRPDYTIMGETPLAAATVMGLVRLILSLTPIGSQIMYSHTDLNGKTFSELMTNQDGILTDLIIKTRKPIIAPIIISEDSGIMKADIAICFDSENTFENITAFSNFCPTSRGTHISGLVDGISIWFKKYINEIYLGPKSRIKVEPVDIRSGLSAIIHTAHLDPQFTGQSKDELSNKDMYGFVKDVVIRGLDNWSRINPQDLQKICKYIKDIAEIRQKSSNEKVKLVAKYEQSHLTGLPAKFTEPTGKEDLELWIVEGDSAGGSAKTCVDHNRQGVFPIRGKIINPYSNSFNKLMQNQEIQGICVIITNGELKNFSLSALRNYPVERVKYKRIIFGPDADVDGAHINALLLRVFLFLFPQLIMAGRVYRAVPPLFGLNLGIDSKTKKRKMQYFTEYIDYIRYKQKKFTERFTISMIDGSSISNAKLLNLLIKNVDYTFEMNRITGRYAINPKLLELLLLCKINGLSNSKIIRAIKSRPEYAYININIIDNTMIIKGLTANSADQLVNGSVDTIYFNDKLISECQNIIALIKDNDNVIYYQMNGIEASLYEIMTAFDDIRIANGSILEHFKGLGEMDAWKLFESTMDPDGDRMLIQYTIKDITETTTAIRMYESDKTKILNHIGKVTRSDIE